jgi:D-alanyl-lipoteichoic acid acyltransferase DltB (MBOAT superfamily)
LGELVTRFFSFLNVTIEINNLDILLPVGISFYTFQAISYTIDVYRDGLKPERSFIKYALFVSFFPQLVAGPIERSSRLLPQFSNLRNFDYNRLKSGSLLMLWGFFKKIVIADCLAVIVNQVYNNPSEHFGWSIIVATIFFFDSDLLRFFRVFGHRNWVR